MKHPTAIPKLSVLENTVDSESSHFSSSLEEPTPTRDGAHQPNAMVPRSLRSSLLQHSGKLRSQTAPWFILWTVCLLLALAFVGKSMETLPPAYLQGCVGHCTQHMPLVCQNQWSCENFCTNGYLQSRSISVETHANGEQFLTRFSGANCQPRCENIKSAVCQGRASCEKMCTFLYRGTTEPDPKKSEPTLLGDTIVWFILCVVDVFFIADLLCSWLRLCSSYDFFQAPDDCNSDTEPDRSSSERPRFEMDAKTFQCGVAIILRSVLECRVLLGWNSFEILREATILCLLLVDEVLQQDTQELKAPRGIFIVSLLGRVLRPILGHHTVNSREYSVPFATAAPSAAGLDPTRSGHARVAAQDAGTDTAAMTPPVTTEPINRYQAHSSKVE